MAKRKVGYVTDRIEDKRTIIIWRCVRGGEVVIVGEVPIAIDCPASEVDRVAAEWASAHGFRV